MAIFLGVSAALERILLSEISYAPVQHSSLHQKVLLCTVYRAECTDLHAAAGVLPVVLPLPAGGAAGPGPGPLGGGGQGRGLPRLHNIGTMVTTGHLVTSLTCDLALVLDPELWL